MSMYDNNKRHARRGRTMSTTRNTYVVINTETSERYEYDSLFSWQEFKAKNHVLDYGEPCEVACRVELGEDHAEMLVPLHRKRMFAVWSARH